MLDQGLLTSGFNCVLQMPTGSGKTWLAEQAIGEVLSQGQRAIYLTPLRALATELTSRWTSRFAPHRVGVYTGDFGQAGSAYPVPFKDARLLVMTPERLDLCTRDWRAHWAWLPEVDLLVVDEFHLLGEPRRGGRLEGALSRVRRLNPFLRIVALSATLGNRVELADWLDGVDFVSTWRPIPLTWRVVRYRRATDKPTLLATECHRNVQAGGRTLVFVHSRRRAEELARGLVDAGLNAVHHHAGLDRVRRRDVEDRFRSGGIEVLVATSTVEMGVNLPVRQVILYDIQQFDGVGFAALPTATVWQRAGRAGRPGLDSEGEVVLMAPAWDRTVEKYESGRFEPIISPLGAAAILAEQLVAEVASGLSRTESQLQAAFRGSLAATQGHLLPVGDVISEMTRSGMLVQGGEKESATPSERLRVTPLGFIAVRHLLAPSTVLRFSRALLAKPTWSFLDLLLLACASADCEPVLPVDFEELDEIGGALASERSSLASLELQSFADLVGADGKRLLAAFKMALVARAVTRASDDEVAERFDCYPFEVARLCESLERLLTAMASVARSLAPPANAATVPEEEPSLTEKIDVLRSMLRARLDEEAVTLTLVDGIGPKLARRLSDAGISDIEALALAEVDELRAVKGVSEARAGRWIAAANELISRRSAFWYREESARIGTVSSDWQAEIDPYRLRRSMDLQVAPLEPGILSVSGGLEPHRVRIEGAVSCDCADFARGSRCKHLLAVQRFLGDKGLDLRRLERELPESGVDLLALWFKGDRGRCGPGTGRRS